MCPRITVEMGSVWAEERGVAMERRRTYESPPPSGRSSSPPRKTEFEEYTICANRGTEVATGLRKKNATQVRDANSGFTGEAPLSQPTKGKPESTGKQPGELKSGLLGVKNRSKPLCCAELAKVARVEYAAKLSEGQDINIAHVLQEIINKQPVQLKKWPLPSVGSVLHNYQICKPCVFANKTHKVCRNGKECLFCHYDHKEKRRRSKRCKVPQTPHTRVPTEGHCHRMDECRDTRAEATHDLSTQQSQFVNNRPVVWGEDNDNHSTLLTDDGSNTDQSGDRFDKGKNMPQFGPKDEGSLNYEDYPRRPYSEACPYDADPRPRNEIVRDIPHSQSLDKGWSPWSTHIAGNSPTNIHDITRVQSTDFGDGRLDVSSTGTICGGDYWFDFNEPGDFVEKAGDRVSLADLDMNMANLLNFLDSPVQQKCDSPLYVGDSKNFLISSPSGAATSECSNETVLRPSLEISTTEGGFCRFEEVFSSWYPSPFDKSFQSMNDIYADEADYRVGTYQTTAGPLFASIASGEWAAPWQSPDSAFSARPHYDPAGAHGNCGSSLHRHPMPSTNKLVPPVEDQEDFV